MNVWWTLQGATARVYPNTSDIGLAPSFACSSTMYVTVTDGEVFDAVKRTWTQTTLPVPAADDSASVGALDCAADTCVVGGSYFEPQSASSAGGYTSAAWSGADAKAKAVGDACRLDPAGHAELAQDVRDVHAGRPRADQQPRPNFAVGPALVFLRS